ncbi:MAG: hypothetical protein HY906_03090 [Deltaproteobacteria bacterium]|nr:hypothetical protein [Deltaproteobacteria bacterium]
MRRVRRRLRLQAALEAAVLFAIPAAAGVLVAIYAWKIRALQGRGVLLVLAGAAAVGLLGALFGAGRRIPLRRAARAIDRAAGLSDRLGSALEFGPDTKDPFEAAAVEDATRHLDRARPAAAAPFAWPRDLPALGAITLVCLLLLLVRVPLPARPVPVPPPQAATLSLSADDIYAERDLQRALQREAARNDDQEAGDLALRLQRLLDDLEQGKLTHKEAFEKLAELEQLLTRSPAGDFEPVLKELRALGQTLAKEKPTEDLGKAMRGEELALAKEELERIAQKLKDEKLSPKEREELARALDKSKVDTSKQEEQERREREKLEQQQRRLEKERQKSPEKSPNKDDLKRRLEQKRRELEKLTRDQQRHQERRRQLEKLSRDLRNAGREARAGQQQQASRSLEQAAQQMGRFADEQRRGQSAQRMAGQLGELKGTLQRAGKGADGKDGKDGKGKGQGDGKKGKLANFYERAKGAPRPGDLIVPEQGGDLSMEQPGGGQQGPQGEQPGPGQPGEGKDSPKGTPGDGIGDSHDPNLLGERTRLRAKHKNVLVPGKEGAGPTRAETILSASDRGFSNKAYRKVYRDYTSVAEEAMNREKVPLGFKSYVKRYFRLIMPRE